MRQFYNQYRTVTHPDNAWYPYRKGTARFKHYPMLLYGLAGASVVFLLKPIYIGVENWPWLVEDRRILMQRKRLFEMLVLTPTHPTQKEEWDR